MTVEVEPDVFDHPRPLRQEIAILVKGVDDPTAALSALQSAAAEIADLDIGRPEVMRVAPPRATLAGPYLTLDGQEDPELLLTMVVDVVARHLEEAGLHGAIIASPPLWGLWGAPFEDLPRAVTLRALPRPQELTGQEPGLPASWLAEARRWVCAGLAPDEGVGAAADEMQFPIRSDEVEAFFDQCRQSPPAHAFLLTGGLDTTIRAANACLWWVGPSLALAFGGPGATDDALLDAMESLKEVARRLAEDASCVYVSLEATFGNFANVTPVPWRPGAAQGNDVRRASDEIVIDAAHYQVLGPGHLRRLGAMPDGSRLLPKGRFELQIGKPGDWLLKPAAYRPGVLAPDWERHRRDPGVQERARQLLRPCLLQGSDVRRYFHDRRSERPSG